MTTLLDLAPAYDDVLVDLSVVLLGGFSGYDDEDHPLWDLLQNPPENYDAQELAHAVFLLLLEDGLSEDGAQEAADLIAGALDPDLQD